jgi:hypothetical protein
MNIKILENKLRPQIKKRGFTIVEILIVAPIVILVIGVFIGVVVNMTGDVLATRGADTLAYNIQDALNRIEQDVTVSGGFLATNNITLTSPQGYDDGTAPFTNIGANGTMLILNSYATSTNPLSSVNNTIYAANQPNPCSSAQISQNPAVIFNIVYFVKNGTLWRRVVAPANYATAGCSVPWQQPSCSPGVSNVFCKSQDIRLVDGINSSNGFSIDYYTNSSSTTPNDSSNPSNAVRQAILQTTNTVAVTINATANIAGRSASQTGIMRTVSPNNNIAATSPAITSQPQNKTALASDTNVTFSATATGTSPTAQWQQSTDQGTTWSNISGATSSTLTLATVNNTMDGYKYRVIFSNGLGQVTSSSARLGVNLLAWTTLSMQNSWTNYNSGYNTAAYRKTSDGVVVVKGLIARSGTPVSGEVIGTLPVSYRPSTTLIFLAGTNPNTYARIDVYPNGNIIYVSGDPGWLSMDNIHFAPDTGRYTRVAASSFFNGWINYGSGFAPASYVIDNSGRVDLQGLVAPGTWPDGTRMYDLPSAALPSNYMHIAALGNVFSAFSIDYRAGATGAIAKGIGNG